MPERRGQQEAESGMSPTVRAAIQGILLFLVGQFLMKQLTGGGSNTAATPGSTSTIPSFSERPTNSENSAAYSFVPERIAPIWPADSELDIRIYVSPSVKMPALRSAPAESLIVEEKAFRIGDWKDKREIDTTFVVPSEVQNNGTLWAHFYVALKGAVLDPAEKSYDSAKAYHFARPLNQYLMKKKVSKAKKLLGGSEGEENEDAAPTKGRVITSYYHPNFTISLIPDSGVMNFPSLHPALRQFVYPETTDARDATGQNGWYYPIVFVNTFWQLRNHMTELNSTVKTLPIHISLNNLNNWKFTLMATIDDSMKQNQRQIAAGGPVPAGGDGSEMEEVKRVILDTNIWLLGTTGIVSILHMIFEMLAFKSDISHWRNKKDNVGISVRTILANVFMQTVILLYLIDNSDGTSYMILVGQGFGILLEAWKITKMVDVRIRPRPANSNSLFPYQITFEDKHKLSVTEQKTKEYDQIAFRYLYMIAVPLLGAYAVYSVLYDTHKSWYSFVITTLVGSVYAYGFLMMVPSLYINYRLKSVAHMPAKAMTYKFLNTFIDDLFAFTIKMPTLHRLATLRDDVIFFVYLYQSWKYKVDYTRVNEFGQGGDDDEEVPLDGALEKKEIAEAERGSTALAEEKEATKSSGREDGGGEGKGAKKRK